MNYYQRQQISDFILTTIKFLLAVSFAVLCVLQLENLNW